MKFDIEILKTTEEVIQHIQQCEGQHIQQAVYSTFHNGLTQICFGCMKVRTSVLKK